MFNMRTAGLQNIYTTHADEGSNVTLHYFESVKTGGPYAIVYNSRVIIYFLYIVYIIQVYIDIPKFGNNTNYYNNNNKITVYVHFVVGSDETSSTKKKKSRNSLPPAPHPSPCRSKPVQNRFRCPIKWVQKFIQCK